MGTSSFSIRKHELLKMLKIELRKRSLYVKSIDFDSFKEVVKKEFNVMMDKIENGYEKFKNDRALEEIETKELKREIKKIIKEKEKEKE